MATTLPQLYCRFRFPVIWRRMILVWELVGLAQVRRSPRLLAKELCLVCTLSTFVCILFYISFSRLFRWMRILQPENKVYMALQIPSTPTLRVGQGNRFHHNRPFDSINHDSNKKIVSFFGVGGGGEGMAWHRTMRLYNSFLLCNKCYSSFYKGFHLKGIYLELHQNVLWMFDAIKTSPMGGS